MGDARLVTLSSTSHSRDVLEGIWNCFLDKYKVDIEITCNGRSLKAHQLLLAALCPWLKEPLNSVGIGPTFKNDGKECTLNLDHITNDGSDMDFLIEFMYRGRTTVPENRLESLGRAAQTLGVQGLVDAIKDLKANTACRDDSEDDEVIDERSVEGSDNHHRNSRLISVSQGRSDHRMRKCRPVKLLEVVYASQEYNSVSDDDLMDQRWTGGCICGDSQRGHGVGSDGDVENEDDEGEDEEENGSDAIIEILGNREDNDVYHAADSKDVYDEASSNSLKSHHDFQTRRRVAAAASKVSRSEYKRLWRLSRPLQKCSYCDYETRDKVCFASHVAKHDPTAERFVCDICQKTFRSKKGFNYHQRSHLGPEQLHKCLLCDFYTPVKSSWVQHLAVKHKVDKEGNPLPESYRCNICDYVCVTDSKLKEHFKRKHTSWKNDYEKHILSRHGRRSGSIISGASVPETLTRSCERNNVEVHSTMTHTFCMQTRTALHRTHKQAILSNRLHPAVELKVKDTPRDDEGQDDEEQEKRCWK